MWRVDVDWLLQKWKPDEDLINSISSLENGWEEKGEDLDWIGLEEKKLEEGFDSSCLESPLEHGSSCSRCDAGSVREQFEKAGANERLRERRAGKDIRPQGRYRVSPPILPDTIRSVPDWT